MASAPVLEVESWGRTSSPKHTIVSFPHRFASFPETPLTAQSMLPVGLLRSYGDSCLNAGQALLPATSLDHILEFDRERGLLRVEGGCSLRAVLEVTLRQGWFVPVTPGTQNVTVAGAIANDVHGKNHHRAGTFGCHVLALTLLRSDRDGPFVCSPKDQPDLFAATVGGLGLTGIILDATIQLMPVVSAYMDVEAHPFHDLDEFDRMSEDLDPKFPYSVAWIDVLRTPPRGILLHGRHSSEGGWAPPRRPRLLPAVGPWVPGSLLNRWSVGAFNYVYFHAQRQTSRRHSHFAPFFYPLDGVTGWNYLYGPGGFFQFQCVIPLAARAHLETLLRQLHAAGQGSFLAVLKRFGAIQSPGWLSFPQPGYTLAIDIANRGQDGVRLVRSMMAIVREAGGRIYPAKDALMSKSDFQSQYPAWVHVERLRDPRLCSSFWRRCALGSAGTDRVQA